MALGIEGGDFRGLTFDLHLERGHPIGDFLGILVDRSREFDVLVLGTPRDAVDVGILAALLVLEDVVLDRQAVALRPVPKIAVTVDLDPESEALSVGMIGHRFLLSAGRSGSRRAPDRPAVLSSTGTGSGHRACQRAHPCPYRLFCGPPATRRRSRSPTRRDQRGMTPRRRSSC